MTLKLSQSHLEFIEKIAENEGIKHYQLETNSGKQKGDGYLSNIVLVSIISSEKTLNILLKVASDSVKLRTQAPLDKVFSREIFMYKEVFKHYEQLQKKSEKLFTPPKFYGYIMEEYKECLAFENLKEKNFQLWDRTVPMDHEHMNLIIETYGKYHALSFITKYRYPEKYQVWTENIDNIRKEYYTDNFDIQFRKLFNTIIDLFDNKDIKGKIAELRDNWIDIYFSDYKGDYAVLTHGDSWCNNFLFKYQDATNTTKPTDIRLLDFQLAIFTSPIHDLSYCLFTDTDEQFFSNYRDYLSIYHHTLTNVLENFDLDINTVYPYEILVEEWEQYAKYGLVTAILILKAALVSSEDAVDIVESAENDCDVIESYMESASASEEYYSRVKELIEFFFDNDLI